ncbi:hypothetical protein HPB47_017453 [Ixodes persulcatus]|uniref:Uncharacterized protein n=1 Tax=Ixodes persulcatus TaxID=34615 RepID=A0AC60R0V6_IXOPE|nr:hypothetical protein HPB47_017453 [Ixodes persulcatus]
MITAQILRQSEAAYSTNTDFKMRPACLYRAASGYPPVKFKVGPVVYQAAKVQSLKLSAVYVQIFHNNQSGEEGVGHEVEGRGYCLSLVDCTTAWMWVLEKVYDESGRCMPPGKKLKQGSIRRPQRLVWDISPELEGEIAGALANARKNNEDLDLYVRDHDSWGKGVIKKCKVSPDAFIQMALQLTYYKENKKFVQTYEASMTRLYLNGRTETVRSCTLEAVDFVKAMVENSVSNEEKIRLLRRAANKHQMLYRDAMSGKGVDRHLFALFVACKGLKYESEFLTNAIMRPWTLSTSQTPHTQLDYSPDADLEVFTNKICPGGGFGPVSDDGYGVSYIIPNNSKIFFHVSSKKSCPNTNSERFVKTLDESMDEMKALFSF